MGWVCHKRASQMISWSTLHLCCPFHPFLTHSCASTVLGTRIPKSGSTYTYIKEAWGKAIAFVYLWSHLILVRPMGTALGAMTAAEYILRPVFQDCPEMAPRPAKVLIALCIICECDSNLCCLLLLVQNLVYTHQIVRRCWTRTTRVVGVTASSSRHGWCGLM